MKLLLGSVVLVFLMFSSFGAGENLIRNGNCNSVSGWKLNMATRASDKLKLGNKVIELRPSRSSWSRAAQKVKFATGSYKLTFRARVEGGDGSDGCMGLKVAPSRSLSNSRAVQSFSFNLNNQWQDCEYTFTTNKKKKVKFLIFHNGNTKGTKLHIDDVVLLKVK